MPTRNSLNANVVIEKSKHQTTQSLSLPTMLKVAISPILFCMAGEAIALSPSSYDEAFYRYDARSAGATYALRANGNNLLDFSSINSQVMVHDDYQGSTSIKLEYADSADESYKFSNRHLIMDGGSHAQYGNATVKNAMITMQGWADHFEGDFDDAYWTERGFRFTSMNLTNSTLNIGRNAWLESDLILDNSIVRFGGDVPVFHDKGVSGSKQQLVQGNSRYDYSVHYKGNIKAKNSKIDSYMNSFQASFDMDNSTFINHDKNGLTFLLRSGIKLKNKSVVELGNIKVLGNRDPKFFDISSDSKLTVNGVHVIYGNLDLPDDVASGTLFADTRGTINVNKWHLKDGNLKTASNGKININTLTTSGAQKAYGNIAVNELVALSDLRPHRIMPDGSDWVGLDVFGTLTLAKDTKVKAHFSNDFLSLNNVRFGKPGTLIRADKLIDNRTDKIVEYDTHGIAVEIDTYIKDNKIILAFISLVPPKPEADGTQPPVEPEEIPGLGEPIEDPDFVPPTLDEIVDSKDEVVDSFFENDPVPGARDELQSIIEHNKNGDNKFQEVALQDALTMQNSDKGADSLISIANRTAKLKRKVARTIHPNKLVAPVRRAIDTRLASLRRSARSSTATYTPVAAIGTAEAINELSLASEETMLHESIFVDVSGSVLHEDDLKEHTLSTNIGYDRVFPKKDGRIVVGGAFNATKIDNKDTRSEDDAIMYGVTGYFSFEQKEGFEFQSYLTGGYLINDRSFIPNVKIGEQKFDERSWLLMSSNYFKYHFHMGALSVRPMLLADLGWHTIGESKSSYLKRDDLSQTVVDLGLGLELEGAHESIGYMLQATLKRNVYTSNNEIGVNLVNANGYMTYDIPEDHSTVFSINGSLSKRLAADVTLDVGLGGSLTSEGGVGANGNARIRWHF